MICWIGRVMRVGAASRPATSWPHWSGRWTGWPGWGCSTRRKGASWDGCASVPVARARGAWRSRPRRRREADMRGRRARETDWPALLGGAAVGVWGWRLGLGALATLVGEQRLAAGLVGEHVATVMVAGLTVAVVAVGPVRRLACRSLRV